MSITRRNHRCELCEHHERVQYLSLECERPQSYSESSVFLPSGMQQPNDGKSFLLSLHRMTVWSMETECDYSDCPKHVHTVVHSRCRDVVPKVGRKRSWRRAFMHRHHDWWYDYNWYVDRQSSSVPQADTPLLMVSCVSCSQMPCRERTWDYIISRHK